MKKRAPDKWLPLVMTWLAGIGSFWLLYPAVGYYFSGSGSLWGLAPSLALVAISVGFMWVARKVLPEMAKQTFAPVGGARGKGK